MLAQAPQDLGGRDIKVGVQRLYVMETSLGGRRPDAALGDQLVPLVLRRGHYPSYQLAARRHLAHLPLLHLLQVSAAFCLSSPIPILTM